MEPLGEVACAPFETYVGEKRDRGVDDLLASVSRG
jgi:hypothetical protein